MTYPLNFSAGPAAIPRAVLEQVREELLDWQQTGLSILETGHRTPQFTALGEKLQSSVRRILQVPDDFAVLFLPGGGQVQFAMLAMNLAGGFSHANYVETGHWSAAALKEGQKYLNVHLAASSRNTGFQQIPPLDSWDIRHDAAFLHFTDNETIGGVEFPETPDLQDMVLVSDMSSNIFSRPVDFNRMDCIYACAQKNLGIAGMSLVIVRRDLLDRAMPQTPAVFSYANQEKNHSLACTPTTFAWYLASLTLDWLEAQGGVEAMAIQSLEKSRLLYDYIDASGFYSNSIDPSCRSRMNLPFVLQDKARESQFFKEAKEQGLLGLEGHRSTGGVRASLYNAISVQDVQKLIHFMRDFATK